MVSLILFLGFFLNNNFLFLDNVPLIIFDDDWENRLRKELESIEPKKNVKAASQKIGLDNLAYLVYSSGTTGKPKGNFSEYFFKNL